MGTPKHELAWHGSTLLSRVVGILSRSIDGPLLVVRASHQELPRLSRRAELVDDERGDLGPLQGLAGGLAALTGRAEVAFVCATDLPYLHEAFVRRVLAAADDEVDVALPVARGYAQPLAAAYRVRLAPSVTALVAQRSLRFSALLSSCAVRRLDEEALLGDPVLAALDPELDSLCNLNTPAQYASALQRPAPEVVVWHRAPSTSGPARPRIVRAATLAGAAHALGLDAEDGLLAIVNGAPMTRDGETPLIAGDTVLLAARRPRP
jgi:molybdopterin-guanine dinucleotide biosynthesis protein A